MFKSKKIIVASVTAIIMIIFAIFGVAINFIAAYFTKDGDSLNQKAVNLHMLEDVLGWLIVLIGGIIIGKITQTRRFIWGISLGIFYFLLLLLITLGVYRTVSTDMVNLITTWILCVGGGMIGGMLS